MSTLLTKPMLGGDPVMSATLVLPRSVATVSPIRNWSGETYAHSQVHLMADRPRSIQAGTGFGSCTQGGSLANGDGRTVTDNTFPIRTGRASCSPPV